MVLRLTIEQSANYNIQNIEQGLKKEFQVTITESIVDEFAKLSGDYNHLHMDEEYAKSVNFKGRVCHGMLIASFLSRLIGMYIPGQSALYLTQSLKFANPCYVNDVITVTGTVISKSISTGIITVDTTIKNSLEKPLIEGQAKVLIRK